MYPGCTRGRLTCVEADGRIVIEAARAPRAGWAEAAKAMHAAGEDVLLDAPSATRFDREEWEWR